MGSTTFAFSRLILVVFLLQLVRGEVTTITYETAKKWIEAKQGGRYLNRRSLRTLSKGGGSSSTKSTKAPKSSGSGKKGSSSGKKSGSGKKTAMPTTPGPTCNPTASPSAMGSTDPPSGSPTTPAPTTSSPTNSPTETPTMSPTDSPTVSPTDSPTGSPTQRCQTFTMWADAFEVFFGFEQNSDGFFEWYPVYSEPAVTPQEKEDFYLGQFLNSGTAPYPVPPQFDDIPENDSLQYGIYEFDLVILPELGGRALSSLAVANTRITYTPGGSLQTKSIQSGTGRYSCASGYQELFPEADIGDFGFFRIVSTICTDLCPPPGVDFDNPGIATEPSGRRLKLPAGLRKKADLMEDQLPESFKATYLHT